MPKHRLVDQRLHRPAWDFQFSGKLTLSSPTPKDATNCYDVTTIGNCYFDPLIPSDEHRLQVSWTSHCDKSFDTGTSLRPWVRVDVVNLLQLGQLAGLRHLARRPVAGRESRTSAKSAAWPSSAPPRTWKLSVGFDF